MCDHEWKYYLDGEDKIKKRKCVKCGYIEEDISSDYWVKEEK